MQVEMLHKYGAEHPETKFGDKVRGVTFSDNVEIYDPYLSEMVKKPIKPLMVNILVKWLEDNKFIYPASHATLTKQLRDYKVIGVHGSRIKYTDKNEHLIDATCLAAFALWSNYTDPFAFDVADEYYILDLPKYKPEQKNTPSLTTIQDYTMKVLTDIHEEYNGTRDFTRTSVPFLDTVITRSNF